MTSGGCSRRDDDSPARAGSGSIGFDDGGMKRATIYFLIGIAVGVGGVAGFLNEPYLLKEGGSAQPGDDYAYAQLKLFGEAFDDVRARYVDEPDQRQLVKAAISAMVTSLDPHSGYADAKTYLQVDSMTKGEYGDIGAQIAKDGDAIKVLSTVEDTSAAKAGIEAGDVIAAIDDAPTGDMTLDEAAEKLRGPIHSAVRLKVLRGSAKSSEEYSVARDIVKIQSVRSHVVDDDIGYIRITQFTDATGETLKTAIDTIRASIPPARFKGYILDLRSNPGGYIDQAVKVVNSFVDKGEIVSTRGRRPGDTKSFQAEPGGDISGGYPLVVLINGASASASEIVSGALQDLKRATVMGTRSFGKGSVQTTIMLGQDGALRLTIARYYTPSGRSIQAKGIAPDLEVLQDIPKALVSRYVTRGEASLAGHLRNDEGESSASQFYVPSNPKDDKQLIAAIELLRGEKSALSGPAPPDEKANPSSSVARDPVRPN